MESFALVVAPHDFQLKARIIILVYTTVITVYCILPHPNLLVLAGLNLLGSVAFAALYFSFTFSSNPEVQALVCAWFGFCYAYYITELCLFANRTATFYSMQPQQKYIRIASVLGMGFFYGACASDVIMSRDWGVYLWNGAKSGIYCYGQSTPPLYFMGIPLGFLMPFVGYMGVKACVEFVQRTSSTAVRRRRLDQRRENFLILKLMLTSFAFTVMASVFITANVLVPIPAISFYVEHILAVATPIDTILSLILSAVVFHKIKSKGLQNSVSSPRSPPQSNSSSGHRSQFFSLNTFKFLRSKPRKDSGVLMGGSVKGGSAKSGRIPIVRKADPRKQLSKASPSHPSKAPQDKRSTANTTTLKSSRADASFSVTRSATWSGTESFRKISWKNWTTDKQVVIAADTKKKRDKLALMPSPVQLSFQDPRTVSSASTGRTTIPTTLNNPSLSVLSFDLQTRARALQDAIPRSPVREDTHRSLSDGETQSQLRSFNTSALITALKSRATSLSVPTSPAVLPSSRETSPPSIVNLLMVNNSDDTLHRDTTDSTKHRHTDDPLHSASHSDNVTTGHVPTRPTKPCTQHLDTASEAKDINPPLADTPASTEHNPNQKDHDVQAHSSPITYLTALAPLRPSHAPTPTATVPSPKPLQPRQSQPETLCILPRLTETTHTHDERPVLMHVAAATATATATTTTSTTASLSDIDFSCLDISISARSCSRSLSLSQTRSRTYSPIQSPTQSSAPVVSPPNLFALASRPSHPAPSTGGAVDPPAATLDITDRTVPAGKDALDIPSKRNMSSSPRRPTTVVPTSAQRLTPTLRRPSPTIGTRMDTRKSLTNGISSGRVPHIHAVGPATESTGARARGGSRPTSANEKRNKTPERASKPLFGKKSRGKAQGSQARRGKPARATKPKSTALTRTVEAGSPTADTVGLAASRHAKASG